MTEITYVPNDTPLKVGEYDGADILMFGAYRVRFEDTWTALIPHTGFKNTVSEEPVWLDGNPEFCEALIARADSWRPDETAGG